MMRYRIANHVMAHPWRGILTAGIVMLACWGTAIYALQLASDRAAIRQRTLKQLCANQHFLEDVLIGGIAIVKAERNDRNLPDATHRADDEFIARFRMNLKLLRRDFSDSGSLCHNVPRLEE